MYATHKRNLQPSAITLLILAATLGGITMQPEARAGEAGEKTMNIVRIYTGADNQSHFEDVQVPLKSTGKIGFISELMKATGIVFRETGTLGIRRCRYRRDRKDREKYPRGADQPSSNPK